MRLIARVFHSSTRGKLGLVIVAALAFAAVLGPVMVGADPNAVDVRNRFLPPSGAHPLGTDDLGRDVLARILYGSRVSLMIGIGSVVVSAVIGHALGMAAGMLGGIVDIIIGRVTDVFFAIPSLLTAIGLIAILGPSARNSAIAIGLGAAPLYVRIVRSAVVQARTEEFVTQARVLGVSSWRILGKDVWLVIMPTVVVQSTMLIGFAILNEAGLGFLGLGVQPPEASWGSMLTTGRRFFLGEPTFLFVVAAVLAIAVFGLNLLADGLSDALDPRTRRTERRIVT